MNILLSTSFTDGRDAMVTTGRCQIRTDPALGLWPPVDLAQLAAVLEPSGAVLKIMDFAIEPMGEQQALEKIGFYRPDICIVHSSTSSLSSDIAFFGKLRGRFGTKVVFFGMHATARPQDILSEDIPFAVRGEPEETMKELVSVLKSGGELSGVKGLSFWSNGKTADNPSREFIYDLDILPIPARSLLDNHKYVLSYLGEPFTVIQVSRGCPHGCSFCTCRMYYGSRWRSHSVERITSEMERVKNHYMVNNFLLLADTFNQDRDFVMRLCRRINERRLHVRWMCNSRVDCFDAEMAKFMKQAGCFLVSFGVESSSDAILSACGKKTTALQAAEAVKTAREAELRTVCYFMFGLPGETPGTIEDTIRFAAGLGCDYAYFYAATPFPGTPFYEQAVAGKWIAENDWSAFSHGECVLSLPSLPRETLTKAVEDAHKSFYLRVGKVTRELGRAVSEGRFGFIASGARFLKGIALHGRRDGKGR